MIKHNVFDNREYEILVKKIVDAILQVKMDLHNEMLLQEQIASQLIRHGIVFRRAMYLDDKNIPDFFIDVDENNISAGGIAVEVKINGRKSAIYRQCERYCKFPQVVALILATNQSIGLPQFLNKKPCYIISLSKAWL